MKRNKGKRDYLLLTWVETSLIIVFNHPFVSLIIYIYIFVILPFLGFFSFFHSKKAHTIKFGHSI